MINHHNRTYSCFCLAPFPKQQLTSVQWTSVTSPLCNSPHYSDLGTDISKAAIRQEGRIFFKHLISRDGVKTTCQSDTRHKNKHLSLFCHHLPRGGRIDVLDVPRLDQQFLSLHPFFHANVRFSLQRSRFHEQHCHCACTHRGSSDH